MSQPSPPRYSPAAARCREKQEVLPELAGRAGSRTWPKSGFATADGRGSGSAVAARWCRADNEARKEARKAKAKSEKQKASFAARRQAALERIGKAMEGAMSRDEVAKPLGGNVSRQRISQIIPSEEATGQTLPLIGFKPNPPQKPAPEAAKGPQQGDLVVLLPNTGRFCRRRKGHFGPHGHWASWVRTIATTETRPRLGSAIGGKGTKANTAT